MIPYFDLQLLSQKGSQGISLSVLFDANKKIGDPAHKGSTLAANSLSDSQISSEHTAYSFSRIGK